MRYITKVTHFLQYIDDDSKGPDVTGQVILFWSQHLWSWKKRGLTNSAKKVSWKSWIRSQWKSPHQHSRACNKALSKCPVHELPWQTQSRSTSTFHSFLQRQHFKFTSTIHLFQSHSPLLEKRRFSGLRSLWAMFLSCKNFTALQISFTISAASETMETMIDPNWTLAIDI